MCDNIEKTFTEYAFDDSYATSRFGSATAVTDKWDLYEFVPRIYELIGFRTTGKIENGGQFEYWHHWEDYSEFEKGLEDFKKNELEECVEWICAVINEKRGWMRKGRSVLR